MTASASKADDDPDLQEALEQSWQAFLDNEAKELARARDESKLQHDYGADRGRALEPSKEEEIIRAKDESMLRHDEESKMKIGVRLP